VTGKVSDLVTEGSLPVGLVPEATFVAKSADLLPGDTLALYSDGITEAIDPDLESVWGRTRLAEVLAGKQGMPLAELQKDILKAVETFCRGASQSDDITVMLVRYRPDSLACGLLKTFQPLVFSATPPLFHVYCGVQCTVARNRPSTKPIW
jgi:hypothetical protein